MIWLFRRPTPSQLAPEASEAMASSARQLDEARKLRRESAQVGEALRKVHRENHIAVALERAIRGAT